MFRRRSTADPVNPAQPESSQRPGAKGRPTPKRREAERNRRRRVRPPKDRKEAYRHARARARAERLQTRQALVTGDEKNLPPRDRGPVRAFVRDLVDSRRRAGELFLPGAILVFVLNVWQDVRVQTLGMLVWLLLVLTIAVQSFALVRTVKRTVSKRFPGESTRGLAAYTVMRSMQIRRLRLPPPRVKPGAKV